MNNFAALNLHISLTAEPLFHIGPLVVTNSVLLGTIALVFLLVMTFYVVGCIKKGKYNRLVGFYQWMFDILMKQINGIIHDRALARRIAPLAITIFLFILATYWFSILPGVGSITYNGTPLFRGLPADLNFTFALAIITVITVQMYAIKYLGLFKNAGRYFKNPLKDPIGMFEGLLELVGEVSRGVSLSFRLFGNAFAGEVLLLIIAVLTSAFASVALPIFMAFEMFIGFIQAYVFFVLTLIFTALALESHSSDHSSVDHSNVTKRLE